MKKSLEAFLQPHPTSVQVDTDRISMEEITASLQAQGITVTQKPGDQTGIIPVRIRSSG